jgi:hypothetical protein
MESCLVRVHAVSGTYFRTLRLKAVMGRTLTEEDDRAGAPLVALARDPELFGQTIRLYGHLFSIVGVAPNDFTGLDPLAPADIIVPYAADHLFPTFQRNAWAQSRIIVQLKDGVPADQARAETEVILHQLIRAEPPKEAYDPPRLYLEELSTRLTEVQQNVTRPLQLLGATVGLLLVIMCANIGGLLFARGCARHKELATRLALGGPRRRIVQQLLAESLVLCAAGATLGILVALALTPLLPRLLNELGNTSAVGLVLRPNAGVLTFAIVVSGFCSALFGLLPAIAVTPVDPMQTLKHSSGVAPPSRLRGGKAALAVQLALAMVVIVGAGLLVRTMINLRAVPLGYGPEGLLFVETNNPVGRPRAVVEETLAALQALPGVSSAAVSQWPIFNNATPRFPICVPGTDLTPQPLDYSFVFPSLSRRCWPRGFRRVVPVASIRCRRFDTSNQRVTTRAASLRVLHGLVASGAPCQSHRSAATK